MIIVRVIIKEGCYWQVLEELASAHPVARLLQERRTLAKVLADFVNTFSHRARRASFGSPGVVRISATASPILHLQLPLITAVRGFIPCRKSCQLVCIVNFRVSPSSEHSGILDASCMLHACAAHPPHSLQQACGLKIKRLKPNIHARGMRCMPREIYMHFERHDRFGWLT